MTGAGAVGQASPALLPWDGELQPDRRKASTGKNGKRKHRDDA